MILCRISSKLQTTPWKKGASSARILLPIPPMPKGATVNVYVSSGPSDTTVTVPSNLIGLPLETARQVLVDAGLSVGQTSPRDDTGKEEGVIVDCYPAARHKGGRRHSG